METVIQGSTLQTLRAGLRGTAHAPGEEGYEEASRETGSIFSTSAVSRLSLITL
jgi:hypothetical protein